MKVCATTAQFPGATIPFALDKITAGVSEGVWGTLSPEHIQLCPQNPTILSEGVVEGLCAAYPQSQLRLHANARVLDRHVLWDVSTFDAQTHHYYRALADRMVRLGATTFSVHSGYLRNCSSEEFWERLNRLRDDVDHWTQGRVCVAVEGLYPCAARPQHIGTWKEYEQLLREEIPFALDLSHLKIVGCHEKTWNSDLVRELLASPLCVEVHVSDNDGRSDRHSTVQRHPQWWEHLQSASLPSTCVIFSEGNLMPRKISLF